MTSSLIDIQDAYIARLLAAHAKLTPRTKGDRFGKTRRAARKEMHRRLLAAGYTESETAPLIKDAYDMFTLEINATE